MSVDPLYRWNRKPTGPCLEKHAYLEHNKGITDDDRRRKAVRYDLEDRRFLQQSIKEVWDEL